LYLGDDSRYVKLVNGGNVEIRATTTSSSASAAWSFGTDGAISTTDPLIINVPNGIPTGVGAIASTTGSWEQNPASNLATTGGSGTGLRVSVTHTGGYASAIAITVAGTGYLDGELITVTSGGSSASFIIAVTGTRSWTFGIDGNLTLPNGAVLRNLANSAIAFGQSAGANNSQGATAIAIGTDAGYYTQGAGAVAIGESAGESYQGANAVAIGKKAGYYYQAANSIILNATGDPLEQTTTSTFTVAPIRNASGTDGILQYNTTTNEVTYSGSITFPDATVQTTAWTGTVAYSNITNVPSVSTSTLVNGTSTITLSSNGNTTFPTGLTLGAPRGVNTVNFTCAVDKEFQIETGTTSTSKLWQFGTTGNTTFPGNLQLNGGKIILNTGGNAYVESVDYGVNTTTSEVNIFGGPYQKIKLRAGFGTEAYWTFGTDGGLTFPDSTVQTTAWTGTVAYSSITGAPAAFNTATLVANAVTATTVSGAAQPNITSVGTLTSLTVNGEIVAQKLTIELTTVTTTLIKTDDIIQTTNTTVSTGTTTGALVVAGGVGIGDNLYVGGVISLPNGATLKDSSNTALAFGQGAGAGVQGLGSVAIGLNSGNVAQGYYSVAVGIGAGRNNQADGAVAVGQQSGNADQGTNAVAIGGYAGETNQSTGTIIINASGSATNGVSGQQNSLYIRPIRSATTTSGVLQYNPTTYEVTYSTTITATASAGTTSTTAAALGYIGMPQNSTATSYTLVAGDQGKHIYISATGQTITIPANTAVAFPIGTTIAFIAGPSATTVTIAITSDTMRLAGAGTTGTRTLAAHGMATAVKVAATDWYINGIGLT
jgi:hypothetical protein